MIFAKNGTAISVTFGPVLNADGTVYASTLAYTDFKIVKNGVSGALNASAAATLDANGSFILALTTSDISAVGLIEVYLNKATLAAPVKEIMVLAANMYDSELGNAYQTVNTLQVNGTGQTARDLGASVLLAAGQKVDVDTIKTQAITCSAGVTVNPQVGSAYELSVASGGKAAATVASGDDADAASIWALVKAGGAGDLAALVTAVGGLVTTIGAACAGVATAIWSAATRTLTAGAFSGTPQTGDSYAVVKSGGTGDLVALKAVTPISVIAAKTDLPAAPNNPTLGTDGKVLVSTDAQDLSGTLSVNAKKLNGATPNNVAATDIVTGGAITTSGGKVSEVATVDAVPAVTLAATQGSYAPAKAGDAMALTSGERTTLAGVIWALATSGMSTVGSIGKKLADWVLGTSQTADVGTLITTVGAAGAGLTALPAVTLAASQPNFAPAKVTDLGTVQTGDTYAIAKSGGGGDLAAIKTALGSAGAGLTSLPAVTLATSQPNYAPAKVADLGTVQTGDSFAVVKSGGTGDLVALKTVTPASAIAAKSDLPGSDVESLMEDVP